MRSGGEGRNTITIFEGTLDKTPDLATATFGFCSAIGLEVMYLRTMLTDYVYY